MANVLTIKTGPHTTGQLLTKAGSQTHVFASAWRSKIWPLVLGIVVFRLSCILVFEIVSARYCDKGVSAVLCPFSVSCSDEMHVHLTFPVRSSRPVKGLI